MTAIEPLTHEHFGLIAEWLSKPEVNRWLTSEWRDRVIDPILIGVTVRNKRNRLFLVRCDGVPCGFVALADLDVVDKVATIWYVLGDPSTGGRGVITEALRLLVRVAFDELEMEALNGWIVEDNDRSRRVLEKNGFREAGRLRRAVFRDGQRFDRIYYDLTRQDLDPGPAE